MGGADRTQLDQRRTQLGQRRLQPGGLLFFQIGQHSPEPVVIQAPLGVVQIEFARHLVDGQQPGHRLLPLKLLRLEDLIATKAIQGLFYHPLHLAVRHKQQVVQILPHHLQQVGVPHPDASARLGNILPLMGTGEITLIKEKNI